MTCSPGCAAARRPIVPTPSSNAPNPIVNRLLAARIALRLHDRKLGELEIGVLHFRLDVAVAKALIGMRRVPWHRGALRLRAGDGQRKHQSLGGVVRDMPGHLVVLLMDVPIEHRDMRVWQQQIDRLRTVARSPIPLRIQIEQGTVREDDDVRILRLLFEVRRKPLQLLLADQRARVRYVVQGDKMHALVVERVMRLAEKLLIRFTAIEGSVVLARHEADVLYLELADDLLELGKALPAYFRVVGGMGQVAREYNKVGFLGQGVYGSNGLFQRSLGVGVGRAFEAPVRVRQLNEIEVVVSPTFG